MTDLLGDAQLGVSAFFCAELDVVDGTSEPFGLPVVAVSELFKAEVDVLYAQAGR